jgi:hypothetical protein
MKPNDTPPPADDPEADNAAGAGCMARLVRLYPESMEWVVETSHGIYSERGWWFSMSAASREDAVRICAEWKWDRMRAYNNHTGEIISETNTALPQLPQVPDTQKTIPH